MKQRKSLVFLKHKHTNAYYIRASFNENPTKEFKTVYSYNYFLIDYIYTFSASKYLCEIKEIIFDKINKNGLYDISEQTVYKIIEQYKSRYDL